MALVVPFVLLVPRVPLVLLVLLVRAVGNPRALTTSATSAYAIATTTATANAATIVATKQKSGLSKKHILSKAARPLAPKLVVF